MNTCLLRFTTCGIKNIDKITSIDFYNNSISRGDKIDLKKKNIKGVFGINGAGKTAYVLAMNIYKSLTTESDYLLQYSIKNKLQEIINKETKELFLETIFAVYNQKKGNKVEEVLKHTIRINHTINDFGQKDIELYEKLEKLIGTTINTKYLEVYNIEKGKLNINDSFVDKEWFINQYNNALEKSTLPSLTTSIMSKYQKDNIDNNQMILYVFHTFINSISTQVFVDNEDDYDYYKADDYLIRGSNTSVDYLKDFNKYIITLRVNEDVVLKDNLDEYLNQINDLKKFIQILKPSLKDIEVDKKFDGERYHCKKKFIYDHYWVDEEYESTGIKRIVKMYSYIKYAIDGAIVFIDELDANISGVFLDKMIEFFAENGKGQLCFTSHNIMSMNILKQYKNSITVIGETGKVVNVVKNGNYQPVKLFYEGFIEDSPFNINSFDFFKAFKIESEN